MSAWPQPRIARPWPPEPRAWEIAWEVDFRALSSQTLTNGTVSLGGRSFTVANAANADTFRIEAGEGLEMAPKADKSYDQPSPTCPLLYIDLEDLLPDYDSSDLLFVQVLTDPSELADTHQGFGQGLGSTRGAKSGDQAKAELRYNGGREVRVGRVWASSDLGYAVSAPSAAWVGQAWRSWCTETRWSAAGPRPLPAAMSLAVPTALATNGGPEAGDTYYFAKEWLRLWLFARWRSLRVWRQRFDAVSP